MSIEIALARIESAQKNKDTSLDLSDLGLEQIPPEILELPLLTFLNLANNQLTEIESLKSLTQLKNLYLDGNQLIELPVFLLDLDIPILWEDSKLIDALSKAKAEAKSLTLVQTLTLALDLTRALNLIKDRARAQARAQSLARDIDDSRNRIQSILIHLTQSQLQNLDRRQTQSLDQALDLARDLSDRFHLSFNRAVELARAQAIGQELGQAQAEAEALTQGLTQIQKQVRRLTKDLSIVQNQVIKTGIFVKGNQLTAPPPEIIIQGYNAIETFLKDFEDKESLNEVKVILVGEGASGKTSLVNRILNAKFNKNEKQTHGIKISKHKFTHQENDLIVNFWDFGGQEIMHATHQFFLTKRCLYLLILDSRKDEKAEYWLNYIQSFGGDAPVIVVLNKNDENSSFDVNRQFLSKKYENVRGYHKVSCLTGIGIDPLREDLMDGLWNLELRNTAFPKGWFKVKQYLESMSDDFINYSKYQSICIENLVYSKQSQKILLDFLNDLGVVLNYEKLRWYDTQVLNPLWLTNAVYRIINSPILAKSNGKFYINDLDAIINDPRYQKENPEHWTNIFKFWKPEEKLLRFPEEKFLFIVAMMKEFELVFQIDEYNYIIPGLLSEEENTFELDHERPVLRLEVEYVDFLPTGIIPRLMVKLNKYIYKDQAWKTGMVLEETLLFNSIANIVLDKESKKIKIEITGKRRRDFLTVIRETIKEINSSYQGLEVVEWVPLPKLYGSEILLVDYQELLGYEIANKEYFFSGKLREEFPVLDLLNGIEEPEARDLATSCHVFISYSHKDKLFKKELSEHLMSLIRLNKATIWDDSSIDAGEEWEKEIMENLEKADIVLCLLSSSFIASDFCKKELDQAIKAHKNGDKTVIPIKIRDCYCEGLPINDLQFLPNRVFEQEKDDKAWAEVVRGVEKRIKLLRN